MLKLHVLVLTLCSTLMLASPATATVFKMDLEGIVDVNHINPEAIGGAVSFSIIFDLDESRADAFEVLNPASEPEFPRWTFEGPPYNLSAVGPLGAFLRINISRGNF